MRAPWAIARLTGRSKSPLSPTSDAVDVVRGLLAVFPFSTLYVADLDAIRARGRQFLHAAPHSRRVSSIADVDRQRRRGHGRARGSHGRGSRRAGHRQRIAARWRADRAAQGLRAGRALARLSWRCVSGPRGDLYRTQALAAPDHRDEPRTRRRRGRPGSRAARRDRIGCAEGAKSMPPAACATPPISTRSKPRAPPAP